MIRLVIADDHRLLLEGLEQALGAVPDIVVAATASDGAELVAATAAKRPEVVLVDLEMPVLGGIEALEQIRALDPPPAAIVVTMHFDEEHRRQAAAAGAAAFLSKSTPLPDLAAAVRAVAGGESLLGPEPSGDVLDRYRAPSLDAGAASLTDRERELLGWLAAGYSTTQELSDLMYISPKTVKNHLANIYVKLAVTDRAQAAVEAIRLGLRAPEQ
jgi:DNA-binding NarL/FixJ family response regulator